MTNAALMAHAPLQLDPTVQQSAGDASDGGTWLEATDQTSGKKYYYNSITKATSWVNPRTQAVQNQQQMLQPFDPSAIPYTQTPMQMQPTPQQLPLATAKVPESNWKAATDQAS